MSFPLATASGMLLGSAGLLLGTSPGLVLEPWGGQGPTPGYALGIETAATNQVRPYNVQGLGATPLVTAFLVADKPATAQDLYQLCAILSLDGQTKTDVAYAGTHFGYRAGLAGNTYTNGFTSVALPGVTPPTPDLTVFDHAAVRLLTAELPSAGGNSPFAFRLNGVIQAMMDYEVHQFRQFSNTFFLGGEIAGTYTWPGTIYACYLYLGQLTEAEKLRTERYLRQRYPGVA